MAAILSNSASLTISDSNGYDGTFALTDKNNPPFIAIPDSSSTLVLGANADNNDSEFDFLASSVEFTVGAVSFNGVSIANPGIGDPVLISHFDGATVNDDAVTIIDNGGNDGIYDFGSATVNAIPEPATYAMLFGLGVLALAAVKRHRTAL